MEAWSNLLPCMGCCKEYWIPSLGSSSPFCLGILGYLPSCLALLIFVFRYAFRPLWRFQPQWMKKFAAEIDYMPTGDLPEQPRKLTLTKWTTALAFLLFSNIALGIYGIVRFQSPLLSLSVLPELLAALILLLERPQSTPVAVLILNASVFFADLAIIALVPLNYRSWVGILGLTKLAITLMIIVLILHMPLRDPRWSKEEISKPFTNPTNELRSPEDDLTLWQWMSVSWMTPLISLGNQRQLHDEDVWLLPFEFQHSRLHLLFRDLKGSVISRLLQANTPDLFIITCLGILETTLEVAEALFLKNLLAALSEENMNFRVALIWSGVILVGRIIRAQSGIFSIWFSRRAYERSRGEMITMVYEKTLRRKAFTFPNAPDAKIPEDDDTDLSGTTPALSDDEGLDGFSPAKSKSGPLGWFTGLFRRSQAGPSKPIVQDGPASTGKILNLMRNDVYEVAQRFWEFPTLLTKPLNFVLSLVLIWRFLGPASLLGIGILVACQVANAFVLRILVQLERSRRAITDTKLQRTTQFVESIRHLRWYDWQDRWLSGILDSREAELRKYLITRLLSKLVITSNNVGAFMFPVAGFVAFTLISGHQLTVDIAFPALDLFNRLQLNLRELPNLFTVMLNAWVAMGRIEAFMAEPNKENAELDDVVEPFGDVRIDITDASFSWPGTAKQVLRDVSVSCLPGLTVVCGKVGYGKTALLQAILGEMDQEGGERCVPWEPISYCHQTPWLQSMSIRQNILFSTPYDEARYRQTLDACCLLPDLAEFKAGDLSLIGENGVGLSGGQRARVALARAVYSQARLLLLDDPIAALDHQTADTILRKLFAKKDSSLMAGRLVVFVTHRVDMITRYADQVLDVVDGGLVKTIPRDELENNEELKHLAANAAIHHEVAEEETVDINDSAIPDKFIEEEHRAHGGVLASVYWQYIKAGGLWWWLALVASFLLFRGVRVLYYWFLKLWGEAYTSQSNVYNTAYTFQSNIYNTAPSFWDRFDFSKQLPSPDKDVHPWLIWFFILSLAQILAYVVSDLVLVAIMYNAGKSLFQEALRKVANATFRFYDVTPVGRLMNRLTSDIQTIDGQIANDLMNVAWYLIGWFASIFVIATVTPIFFLLTLAMMALFVVIFMRFLPTSQALRRLEMVSLSPLMSNFGTLLEGLTTIRAFKAQPHFQNRNIETTDAFQKMDHFYWSLQAWLQYRFDMLSALMTFLLTLAALFSGLSSGTIGFVLASAAGLVMSTHNLCRTYGQLQMEFVSVERVIELLDLEQEPKGDNHPPSTWPSYSDDIEFDNVTLRYAPGLDPSLEKVSFRIPAGSSVAVTGRTGSGKSTLALAMLATLQPDRHTGGVIRIGRVDLATVDKHKLRRSISFVAQDPVLFPGTLRDNLDPIGEHTDVECAQVLERVLGDNFTLTSRVDGGGKNLSQGQRQLVGLGRAMLRRSPLIIMDEATASIDARTAAEIQEVLREELRYSTVITIAHRVEAVKDANFEIVLDKGRVVRCGPLQ